MLMAAESKRSGEAILQVNLVLSHMYLQASVWICNQRKFLPERTIKDFSWKNDCKVLLFLLFDPYFLCWWAGGSYKS